MKKLMIATAALCAAVSVNALESANTVGYTIDKAANNTWKASATPFESTTGASIDLQTLFSGFSTDVYFDDDQVDFKTIAPCVQVQNRDAQGRITGVLTKYYYVADAGWDAGYTDIRPGWVNASGDALGGENAAAVLLAPGTGFWFKDAQQACDLTFAGQVVDENSAQVTTVADLWNAICNPFPEDVALNSAKVVWGSMTQADFDNDQVDFKTVAPCVQIQERDASGNITGVLKKYYYVQDAGWDAGYTDIRPGWANASGDALGGENAAAVTVKAGEGFWFRDPSSNATVTFSK